MPNEDAPAKAVLIAEPDGATPPAEPTHETPAGPTKEERARAALRGEPLKDEPYDPDDISNQFDPETGELLDDETQPAEAAEKEPEQETAEAQAEEAEPEPKEKAEPKRIRINREKMSDRDFAVIRLADDKGITLADAEKILFGDTIPKPKAEEAPKIDRVAEIQKKIDAAMAAKVPAKTAMDLDKIDSLNDEIADLREQMRDAKEDIRAKEREQASRQQSDHQTATQRYETAQTAAMVRVVELYPDANKTGTKLFDALQERSEALRESDPGFFANPGWPKVLAVEVASDLGIAAKVKADAKAVAVPKKVTRPAPQPAPGTQTSATSNQNSEAVFRQRLATAKANNDADAVKAVMRDIQAASRK